MEIFAHFLDIMGINLLNLVEESRHEQKIFGVVNTTFIALIPKSSWLSSFQDYWPIYLCNITYKMISKIIVTCLKEMLSTYISPKQFDFLKNHQIHDVVAISHESLHSINSQTRGGYHIKIGSTQSL